MQAGQGSGVKFNHDMPRSFVLGMAREGGRHVLTSLPTFEPAPAVPEYLPDPDSPRRTRIYAPAAAEAPAATNHAGEDAAGAAEDAEVQFDALDDVFGTQPAPARNHVRSRTAASAAAAGRQASDEEGSDSAGALDGDFIALDADPGSEDGSVADAPGVPRC